MGKFHIRHEDAEAALEKIGHTIAPMVPPGFGFTLLIFNFNEPGDHGGATFYISNAERKAMVATMQEFIDNNNKEAEAENGR